MLEKDFTEVNQVIKHMEPEDVKKISPNFLKMITDNMDENYDFKYNDTKKVYEQNLSKNARIIISIIYIKYLATEEEKKFYYGRLLEDKKLDEEQFSSKNMFKNNKYDRSKAKAGEISEYVDSDFENVQNLNIIKKEEKWYMKFYTNLKNLFNMKK